MGTSNNTELIIPAKAGTHGPWLFKRLQLLGLCHCGEDELAYGYSGFAVCVARNLCDTP
jgi:hypothetical protein